MWQTVVLRWLYLAVRLGIAVLFLWAGAIKLHDPDTFAVIIHQYKLLPLSLVRPVAYILPALEFLAGLALLLDLWGSLGLVTLQMLLFIAVLSYGVWQGLDVDCGCFGMDDPDTSLYGKLKPALYRDFFFLAAIVFLYWARRRGAAVRRGMRFLRHREEA